MNDEITLKTIYDEIQTTRKELRALISSENESKSIQRPEELNCKVVNLEKENKQLLDRVEYLERKCYKNNIVIYGLQNGENVSTEGVIGEVNRLLETDIAESDISDIYQLGRGKNRPLKIEFATYRKKQVLLDNSKKLKGTNIYITQDQTLQQREEQKILRNYLRKMRETTSDVGYVKGNKLIIGNEIYTVDDIRKINKQEEISETAGTTPSPVEEETQEYNAEAHQKIVGSREVRHVKDKNLNKELRVEVRTKKTTRSNK
ncbi:uncharacterized protein LOC123681086 [Harmonia axyridis]|uniref:uncharacterized protein LOC123681086 n=1 Tax=Harmonia axyridis TaxID=115357 RepID=UPI001E275D40|nr:uncharacterized protein LOC123681086 [Harmonia axyridis]